MSKAYMEEMYDVLLAEARPTAAQREALNRALAADPALAEAVARWQAVRKALQNEPYGPPSDRHLLVLFALAEAGYPAAATEDEAVALEAARPGLAEAVAGSEALQLIVQDVQQAAADFEEAWDAHVPTDGTASPRQASRRRVRADRPARASRRAPSVRWAARIGLGVAVAAFVAVLALVLQREQSLVTVTAAEGTVQTVTLADGSSVRLLGGATLVYTDPEADAVFDRRVQLTGRAYFDVVPGSDGFTVETPTAFTTVLGTSFGVRADEAFTEVVLASGRVALASRAAQEQVVVLEPGQASRVAAGALPSTPVPIELSERLAWTGQFVFRDTPLATVAEQLRAYYEIPIEVAAELADERVTGTFAQEAYTAEEILRTLARTLGRTVRPLEGGGFELV